MHPALLKYVLRSDIDQQVLSSTACTAATTSMSTEGSGRNEKQQLEMESSAEGVWKLWSGRRRSTSTGSEASIGRGATAAGYGYTLSKRVTRPPVRTSMLPTTSSVETMRSSGRKKMANTSQIDRPTAATVNSSAISRLSSRGRNQQRQLFYELAEIDVTARKACKPQVSAYWRWTPKGGLNQY